MIEVSVIQLVIGMLFIFTLLSILVTQINTLILNLLNLRAKQLKEGLLRFITDKELQAKVLAHPLVRMVDTTIAPDRDLSDEEAEAIVHSQPNRVEWLPSSTFVEALVSLLTSKSDQSIYKPLIDAIDALPNGEDKARLREMVRELRSFASTSTRELREEILKLPNEMHAQLLSYALEEVENGLGRLPVKSGQLIPLLEGIRKIENENFKTAIETILSTAQSLDEARQKLERWFDDYMQRVTNIYRRKLQWISLALGLLVTVILNADSLQIVRAFWQDPSLRQAVYEAAQVSVPTLEETINQAGSANTQAQTEPGEGGLSDAALAVARTVEALLQLQLPLGWENIPVTTEMVVASQASGLPNPASNMRNLWNFMPGNNPDWFSLLLQKIIGLAVTTIAVAQGAPFWFDLLKRLTTRGSS